MMEDLICGITLIFSVAITAIVVVLGVFFLLTKTKKEQGSKKNYTLDSQREVK